MAKCLILALVVIVAIQGALAAPNNKKAQKSEIETLASEAQQLVKNISSTIDGNIPETEVVIKNLKENTQKFATSVQSVVDDLNKQVKSHEGDIEGILKQVKEALTSTAEKLQTTIGKDATAKAKEIKTNLDEGLEKAIKEAEKLAKAAEPEATKIKDDLTNVAKNLLDKIVEVGNDLKHNMFETTKPGKKN